MNPGIAIAENHLSQFSHSLWKKDANLWENNATKQKSIRNGLGWLHVAEKMDAALSLRWALV